MIYKNIDEVSADDKQWRQIAFKMCRCRIKADDLVNEFYLKYLKAKPKSITIPYVIKAFENSLAKEYNSKVIVTFKDNGFGIEKETNSKFCNFDVLQNVLSDSGEEHTEPIETLGDDMLQFLRTHSSISDWFHHTLFIYHFIDGISMRQLERNTGIHFNIIQKSIAQTKELLQKKYINQYEKINHDKEN